MEATYSPAVFNVPDVEAAKRIILTTEGKLTTEERWRVETPYLVSLIDLSISLGEHSVVLDYGCGIGRMAKALIDKYGCRVVGADISPSMRALAASYVNSPKFLTCAPEALGWLDVEFDAALAIWVLQHCFDVSADVAVIGDALRGGGRLFVVNDDKRIVPTRELGWVNDGKDVRGLLRSRFEEKIHGRLDPACAGELISSVSYWAAYER